MRHGAAIPRSPPHRVGSEVGSPTPLLVPSPTALLALTLGPPRSPLARSVVSAGILVRPDRADVAASPSFGVGGMQAYVTSAVPLRDSRPTGSNDSRSLSARSLATRLQPLVLKHQPLRTMPLLSLSGEREKLL